MLFSSSAADVTIIAVVSDHLGGLRVDSKGREKEVRPVLQADKMSGPRPDGKGRIIACNAYGKLVMHTCFMSVEECYNLLLKPIRQRRPPCQQTLEILQQLQ